VIYSHAMTLLLLPLPALVCLDPLSAAAGLLCGLVAGGLVAVLLTRGRAAL